MNIFRISASACFAAAFGACMADGVMEREVDTYAFDSYAFKASVKTPCAKVLSKKAGTWYADWETRYLTGEFGVSWQTVTEVWTNAAGAVTFTNSYEQTSYGLTAADKKVREDVEYSVSPFSSVTVFGKTLKSGCVEVSASDPDASADSAGYLRLNMAAKATFRDYRVSVPDGCTYCGLVVEKTGYCRKVYSASGYLSGVYSCGMGFESPMWPASECGAEDTPAGSVGCYGSWSIKYDPKSSWSK